MSQHLIDYYNNHIGIMTPAIYADIQCLLNGGMKEDLIKLAIEKSHKCGSWAYARAILRDWINKGIKKVTDLDIKHSTKIVHKDYSIGDEPW